LHFTQSIAKFFSSLSIAQPVSNDDTVTSSQITKTKHFRASSFRKKNSSKAQEAEM